jgi:hypothetical protein
VANPALDVFDGLPGIALIPAPIERFGGDPELDKEVLREVLGLRNRAASSLPMMIRASEPPMKLRLCVESFYVNLATC